MLGLGLLAVLVVLALAAVFRDVTGARFAAPGPGDAPAPTELALEVPADRSPVLDVSVPGEIRTPLRPERAVALTFDDGPDPVWTPLLLDLLAEEGVTATFFVVGERVRQHPEIVERMLDEGHLVANHTYTHPELSRLPAWQARFQLSLTNVALARTGITSKVLRPPYSGSPAAVTDAQLEMFQASGHLVVLTDRVVRDWQDHPVDTLLADALPADPTSTDGYIVTFHDGGGTDRSRTVETTARLIDELRDRGFLFVDVATYVGLDPADAIDQPSLAQRLASPMLGLIALIGAGVLGWVGIAATIMLALGVARTVIVTVLAIVDVRTERRRREQARLLLRKKAPAVSILVPAYNEEAGIVDAVRSLARSDYPSFEIVVIDDGSTDRTAELARAIVPAELGLGDDDLRVISQDNAGKAEALNTGIDAARHGIVVLIDGDTVFEPGTLRALVEPLMVDGGIGGVGGTVVVGNRDGMIGRWQHLEYVIACGVERRMFDQLGCVMCVPGAVGAYRTAVLRRVGGVPTNTLAEDTDLTIAVQRVGYSIGFAPEARAWTEAPSSLRAFWRQRTRWTYGTYQAIWKNRGAMLEPGPGGRLGRFAFPYTVLFSLVYAALGPFIDLYGLIAIARGDWLTLALVWGGFTVLSLLQALVAFVLQRERPTALWALPLQQLLLRPVLAAIAISSLRSAVTGDRLRWQKLPRSGLAAVAADLRDGPDPRVVDLTDSDLEEVAR